jgi:predicted house-cleaning noncanonical NTP pyrophosphatase (MazG superfamily)
MTDSEYLSSLFDKLLEEAQELKGRTPQDILEEAADVYEVLVAVMAATG